ncbi:MAG: hypothetical protein ACYSTT_07360 [Planctomycetota bacterium]|jgi:hypothetical protein
MELTSDNIKTISRYADKLEKWSEILSYDIRSARNMWAELTLSLHPHSVQDLASWLAAISTTGQKACKELKELSELVQKVDAWRYQGVYPEDLGDFCVCINRLMKVTKNIVSLLRNMSGSVEQEPSETKDVTVENSNAPEKPQTNQASSVPDSSLDKSLSREALMAYKLHHEMGLTIQQVAKRMTSELKLDKAPRPWQISRWIKQAESQHKRSRLPIRSIHPKASETTTRSPKT